MSVHVCQRTDKEPKLHQLQHFLRLASERMHNAMAKASSVLGDHFYPNHRSLAPTTNLPIEALFRVTVEVATSVAVVEEHRQLGRLGELELLFKILELRGPVAKLQAIIVQPALPNRHDLPFKSALEQPAPELLQQGSKQTETFPS